MTINSTYQKFADDFLRLNIPMPAFLVKYVEAYNFRYALGDDCPVFFWDEWVSLVGNGYQPLLDYLTRFSSYINDVVSSDREIASFIESMHYFVTADTYVFRYDYNNLNKRDVPSTLKHPLNNF